MLNSNILLETQPFDQIKLRLLIFKLFRNLKFFGSIKLR